MVNIGPGEKWRRNRFSWALSARQPFRQFS
jgi:hypothetical protein